MPLGVGYHIIPVNDWIGHESRPDCVCAPTARLEPDDDDPSIVNFVFTHHALDGRAQ